ncbi:unnamed protein product [Symbiodinium natans]|uniref:Uncharacterized protein n=1 Tax=Symbiodinium natans TaxID=878477 RepID=A0A812VBL6_9DINO|nr:unnamed protein product [Symbiodinium natans]
MFLLTSQAGNGSQAALIARGAASKRKAWEMDADDYHLACLGGSGRSTKNSLRNVLRGMNRLGYSISLKITWIPRVPVCDVGPVDIPAIGLLDMLQYILDSGRSHMLLGGHDIGGDTWCKVLNQFWHRFEKHDPTHCIFRDTSKSERDYLIPLLAYGDEGTGKRKHPVWVLAWKPALFSNMNSYFRTILIATASHALYSQFHCGYAGGNQCLDAILDHFIKEARIAYHQGPPSQLETVGFRV